MILSTVPKTVSATISTRSRAALSALLGLCLSAGLVPEAGAAAPPTFTVTRTADDTAPGSLRSAIALAAGTGGTIVFAIPTTDPGHSSASDTDTITLALGQLNVTGSLTIAAPVAPTIVVSGAGRSSVFSVTGGTVAFSDLTVTKGTSFGNTPGGDILNTGALTLNGCTVSGGSTFGGDGAGIANSGAGAGLTLTNCTVSGNATQYGGSGGGIANGGTLTASGCLFSGNGAGSMSSTGGGLDNMGTATLNGCTLSGNIGGGEFGGGGGAFSSGTLTLNNCLVTGNFTANVGAGIDSTGTLTLSACTVSSNQAGRNPNGSGGGLSCGGPVQMTDCLVVNNFGYNVGGMDSGGALTMTNCTFAGNSAVGSPGFGPFAGGLRSGRATLLNDIFYFDTISPNGPPLVSEIVAFSNTAAPAVSYSDVQGGYVGAGNLSANPQFVRNPNPNASPADPGDEHLKPTSPAVHAGTVRPGVPPVDIEDEPRPTPPARPPWGPMRSPADAA